MKKLFLLLINFFVNLFKTKKTMDIFDKTEIPKDTNVIEGFSDNPIPFTHQRLGKLGTSFDNNRKKTKGRKIQFIPLKDGSYKLIRHT